ncbi:polysaccharide biosynthesis protein [Raoultella planticola]|uniref:Polysaccharide biosynthesis protein n=1 Tax=Raoultella planticola TaxID=575 RepID=A0A8G2A3Y8_RAOPL|nr:lipopolysaccharide biosynthesis protein [Raoultella planticola]SAP64587.1 polysaccharide biosynthesis protein [Raoultella planticola]
MSLASNAKWNMSSQFFKMIAQLVNIIYLAKLIPPSEYGIMAMALVVVNLGILLRDLGTSAAIIQRKDLSHDLVNTVFWLNITMGFGLAFFILLMSPFISMVYNQPKLMYVLILLSITFPLSCSASAHLALLERESAFKKISMVEVSSSAISVIIALILAYSGFGVYSLVGQAIALNLISALQFWYISKWRPSFNKFIELKQVRMIFGFSANLSLFNFINYFSRNVDSFIIGKFMSSAVLGSYNLAYRIMLFPLQSLTFVTTRSLYPILSKTQDDNETILNTYLNCAFIVLLITSPLMTGLAFYSQPFVEIIFGPQWHLTSDVLKWLGPTAILQAVLSISGAVFMAKGRTDTLMRLGILGTFLQVGSFLIGVNYDIGKFAMCYMIANICNFFPVMYFLMKTIGGNIYFFFNKMASIIFSTLIMLVFLFLLDYFYSSSQIDSIFSLILFAFSGAIVYFLSLMLTSSLVRGFVLGKIRKKSRCL